MIVASRIPMLTARMRAATIEAAEASKRGTALDDGREEERLVRRLETLGYVVYLDRVAA